MSVQLRLASNYQHAAICNIFRWTVSTPFRAVASSTFDYSIKDNAIGDDGALALARHLPPRLISLDLSSMLDSNTFENANLHSDNRISDLGAIAIINSLNSPELRSLLLNCMSFKILFSN